MLAMCVAAYRFAGLNVCAEVLARKYSPISVWRCRTSPVVTVVRPAKGHSKWRQFAAVTSAKRDLRLLVDQPPSPLN